MSQDFKAPFLDYEQIRRRADAFLAEHHPSGEIPVPIEHVVEFALGIDIVPIPGLQDRIDTVAFTTSDRREIHIDRFVSAERINRYRFTLAHEVGHLVLHPDFFGAGRWGSIEQWRTFMRELPEDEYRFLEIHANNFGGLVLAPSAPLREQTLKRVNEVKAGGIDINDPRYWEYAWTAIVEQVARTFQVSKEVIEKRFNRDDIREEYAR